MSIYDEIKNRCDEGRLHRLTLELGAAEQRAIWVTPEINDLLFGPWWNKRQAARWGRIRNDLETFIVGGLVTVPQEGRRPRSHTMMARLVRPSSPEVWEIRCLAPEPSIRIFGRFVAQDHFVATRWWRRSWLGPFKHRAWRAASIHCTTDWRNLLPTYRPLASEDYPDGYLTGAVIL